MSNFSYNYLPDNTFKIIFSRLPSAVFYTQEFVMPGISIPPIDNAYPGNNFKTSSGQLDVEDVQIDFIVDENMQAYFEIYNWLKSMNVNSDTFKSFTYSDIVVMPMTANSTPLNHTITLIDCLPIRLGQLTFRTTASDTQYITCSATFAVNDVQVKKVGV